MNAGIKPQQQQHNLVPLSIIEISVISSHPELLFVLITIQNYSDH